MAKFLIYLFESGLCLSLFYLGYILFFRKETYFTFNRFYLLFSMFLALTVPLLTLPIDIEGESYIKETAQEIKQFRNYYENIILLTDPEFTDEIMPEVTGEESNVDKAVSNQNSYPHSIISLASVLFIIYIVGVLFFSFRLLFLLRDLRKTIRHSVIQKEGLYNLVILKDELPSFSFFNWVFVNPSILNTNEFEQVLTHEKVHVEHKHTVDLILAHIITIFQWFNPLTWRIQKSIKTCHEYIADRTVVEKGHELFDYQSLLLSQLISIRSVELVNNFNLLSIKKRIAMMNKNKSGLMGKMKAIALVPILIAAFFLFADMTTRSESLGLGEISVNDTNALYGHWINTDRNTGQVQLLEIKSDKLVSINPEKGNNLYVNEYALEVHPDYLLLNDKKYDYKIEGDQFSIVWDKRETITYTRDKEGNSYMVLSDNIQKLNLPYASQLKPYKKEMILCTISLSESKVFVDGEFCETKKLEKLLKKIRSDADQDKVNKMSVLLNIDRDANMEHVDEIKGAMRRSNNLKLGYLAKIKGHSGSDYMALFNLLPPMDAKWMEKEVLKEEGIELFEIGKNYVDFSAKLDKHIRKNKKYVMLYEYDNSTSYNDYIRTIDLVHKTINSVREEAAQKEGKVFAELDWKEQKVYRKMFPITLTQKNTDKE